jgi:hypothetical protein
MRGAASAQAAVADGFWNEPRYTAMGFPRVFYLRYHGYANSSRSGRWRATAISRAAMCGRWCSGCRLRRLRENPNQTSR